VIRWQYTTAQFITHGLGNDSGAGDLEAAMNQLGSEGWELVSHNVYHNVEAEQDVLLLVFKRPLPPVPDGMFAALEPADGSPEPAPDVTTG
jgi:hypothetical protein